MKMTVANLERITIDPEQMNGQPCIGESTFSENLSGPLSQDNNASSLRWCPSVSSWPALPRF
jgi:hypothetical protein